jgi:hypothetical protein
MKYSFLVLCLIILCSCEQEPQDREICCAFPRKSIEFSKPILTFSPQGGLDSTFASLRPYFNYWSEDWWFKDDGKEGCIFIKPVEEPGYCDNNYCDDDRSRVMKIDCPWFSMARKDDSAIYVSVKQSDNTEKMRRMSMPLEYYDEETGKYASRILRIVQCPEPLEFSKEKLLFGAEGGAETVTVNRDIELHPIISYSNPVPIPSPYPPYAIFGKLFLSDDGGPMPMPIEGPWFNVDMPGENKMIVSLGKNETGRAREIYMNFHNRFLEGTYTYVGNTLVFIEDSNNNHCFREEIEVTQSAE